MGKKNESVGQPEYADEQLFYPDHIVCQPFTAL